MTALDAFRDTKSKTGGSHPADFAAGMAASAVGFAGGMAAINTAGHLVAASASNVLKVVGIFDEDVDNTGGSAAAVTGKVKRGVFRMGNSGGTGAVTAADIGRSCYVVDDATVSRISALGVRPVAGKVFDVDSGGVWVEMGAFQDAEGNIDLLVVAGTDLQLCQYLAVALASDSGVDLVGAAGGDGLGVLQNAPDTAAIAVVRIAGITKWFAVTAINVGVRVAASTTTGKSKAAVAATVNTSDTGAASDAVVGSYVMGIALTAGVQDTVHNVLLQPMGCIPTTAA